MPKCFTYLYFPNFLQWKCIAHTKKKKINKVTLKKEHEVWEEYYKGAWGASQGEGTILYLNCGSDYTVSFMTIQALYTCLNFNVYKLYLKKKNKWSPTGIKLEPPGWSPAPALERPLLLPTPHLERAQAAAATYMSSPDFSRQISASCPTGMSSVSSGVSEVDVVSLKCHQQEHSHLAINTQGLTSWRPQSWSHRQPNPDAWGIL